MSIVKEIECPPVTKSNLKELRKTWIPNVEKYSLDYTGLGYFVDVKSRKKNEIGRNQFIKSGSQICDSSSDSDCVGKQKYIYIKGYPTRKIPNCNGKSKTVSSGIIGGLTEDLFHLGIVDHMKGMIGAGPYGTRKCMRATLPVGREIFRKSKKGKKWKIQSRCIPKQETYDVKYGEEIFKIPFSNCVENFEEEKNKKIIFNNKKIWNLLIFLILSLLFFLLFYCLYVF